MAFTITTDINGYDEPIWQVRDTSTLASTGQSTVVKTFLDPEEACIYLCGLEDQPTVEDWEAFMAEQEAQAEAEFDSWVAKMEAIYGEGCMYRDEGLCDPAKYGLNNDEIPF